MFHLLCMDVILQARNSYTNILHIRAERLEFFIEWMIKEHFKLQITAQMDEILVCSTNCKINEKKFLFETL